MDIAHRLPSPPQRLGLAPPSPWPLAAAYLAAALTTLVLGVAAGLAPGFLLLAPVALLVTGSVETGERILARARRRREADEWILHDAGAFGSRRAWRVAELTSDRERKLLA